MSEFRVQVQSLYNIMDTTELLESVLQQASDSVMSVKKNLRAQIRQRERVDSRLTMSSQQLESQRLALTRVVSTGRQVADFYQHTEQELLGLQVGLASSANNSGETAKTPFALGDLFTLENLWKVVGQAGVVGQTAKAVSSFSSGDASETFKDIIKIAGTSAKLADKGGTANWRDLLGLTVAENHPNGFGDAFSQQLSKYKIGKAQSAGKNIAAGAKWAGNIITVVETGADNWEEFKDDGGWENPRMYAETVVESGIKIGTGLAIGAAVLACTPVGWTALAVGAATVVTTAVVNWALNGVSQLITGNTDGWVENLSDGIMEAGKAMGDTAKAVGNAAKEGCKAVAKWWNNLWS